MDRNNNGLCADGMRRFFRATPGQEAAPVVEKQSPAAEEAERETAIDPKVLYLLMAAELAGQRNQYDVALDGYLQAAELTDDSRVAERAAKIGLFVKDERRTEEAVNLWLERDKENLTARKIAILSALRRANKAEAVDHLNALLALDPGGFESTLVEMIKLMEKDGKDDFIYGVLEELAVQHPDQAEIYFVQALLASKMQQYPQALQKNSRALALQSDWHKALLLQAQLSSQTGDLEAARGYLEQALEQTPEDERIRKMLAQVLVESKAYDDAVDLYREVLDDKPDDGESQFAIALIYLQQQELGQAENYLEKLLHDPAWEAQASFYLGRIAYNREKYDKALVWFDKVSQGPLAFNAKMAAVSLLLSQKRYDEAAERIGAMETKYPRQRVRILLVKAELYSETGQYQQAFDILTDALQSYPDSRELLYTRALIAEQLDKLDVLEADLLKILAQNPDDAGALNALGYTLVDRTERYQEAEAYLQKALRLQPDEAVIIDSYGWLQFKLGHTDEALRYLQRAYDLQPENEIAAHLAELLWVTGEKEKARRLIEEALEKTPEDRYLLDFKKRFLQSDE
nr:tetratricopeptide repeat protein [Methylomarinum sp. Ch1-1]MDP4519033.1 tetratricopeptide repeat protein [Methylomarinum sp. Ch1-1]